ncbi:hypothetical protein ATY79_00800 [Rhizobium sp. R693]|nr:hypothetical protein ATY79_00800 [Rhizobium sp. R693]
MLKRIYSSLRGVYIRIFMIYLTIKGMFNGRWRCVKQLSFVGSFPWQELTRADPADERSSENSRFFLRVKMTVDVGDAAAFPGAGG